MKVEIKVRMLTAGNRSLYLEYYETGFRKRENLHLYLVPDDAPNARKLNEQTYRKAQEIQAQRILTPPSFEKKQKAYQIPIHVFQQDIRFLGSFQISLNPSAHNVLVLYHLWAVPVQHGATHIVATPLEPGHGLGRFVFFRLLLLLE